MEDLKKLIRDAILLHAGYSDLPPHIWRERKKAIFKQFRKLRKNAPMTDEDAERIHKRIVTHKDEILTFLKFPELIEPTNNPAERALRNSVIFRKLTGGTRSQQGRVNVSIISTIIRTARLRSMNPVKVLKTLITDGFTNELAQSFDLPTTRAP